MSYLPQVILEKIVGIFGIQLDVVDEIHAKIIGPTENLKPPFLVFKEMEGHC